jgi:hypothetical protein
MLIQTECADHQCGQKHVTYVDVHYEVRRPLEVLFSQLLWLRRTSTLSLRAASEQTAAVFLDSPKMGSLLMTGSMLSLQINRYSEGSVVLGGSLGSGSLAAGALGRAVVQTFFANVRNRHARVSTPGYGANMSLDGLCLNEEAVGL